MICAKSVHGLKRSPNECSIKTRLASASARLLVDVARTIAVASETTTDNAKKIEIASPSHRRATPEFDQVHQELTPPHVLSVLRKSQAHRGRLGEPT